MRITYEQHPHDVHAPAAHRGPHWQVDWPGRPPGPHPVNYRGMSSLATKRIRWQSQGCIAPGSANDQGEL
jgi:hypothetical protein